MRAHNGGAGLKAAGKTREHPRRIMRRVEITKTSRTRPLVWRARHLPAIFSNVPGKG